MTVADDLERVAHLLARPGGWCQKRFWDERGFCVDGAITRVVSIEEKGWTTRRSALERAICEAAGLPTEHIEVNTLWDLNDDPEMTQERMVALVRLAAQTEREKEAV